MNMYALWLGLTAIALITGVAGLMQAFRRHPKKQALPADVSIRYTTHARQRMSERGISVAHVEAVLVTPARCIRDREQNSVRLESDFNDRILKVWVAEPWPAGSQITVRSTAWKCVATLTIPPTTIGHVIGTGGSRIRQIQNETSARIWVHPDGTVHISAGDRGSVEAARHRVHALSATSRGECNSGGGENMTKNRSYGRSSTSKSNAGDVSSARLHQKSGPSHAFGGYTKVSNTDGTFRMRKSG